MPELVEKIETLPWIEDGINTGAEFNAARGVVVMAKAGYLPILWKESWIDEGSNYAALESLWDLQFNEPGTLSRIISHPAISDGIDEREAKIIAVITPNSPPDLVEKLLDPALVTVEERAITLPLAGETEISIVRTLPGADHALESLEHAVRSVEDFMGLPLPRRHVIYSIEEKSWVAEGINLGNHAILRINEPAVSKEFLASLLAHETSHYYWRYGGIAWINEGAATFLESVAENTLHGPLRRPPCTLARSIAEFEDWERRSSNPGEVHQCNYSLGERLFRDLYRNMDDTSFRLAFRRLYLHTVFEVRDECDTYTATICHVREAFTTYATEETTPTIERVIDRWYDGSEPYDLSEIYEPAVEPDIAAIDGRIEEAYLSISRGGPPIPVVVAGPNRNAAIYLNLDYSYRNPSGLTSLPIEIATYFEDGFEFQRTVSELDVSADASRQTHHVHIPYARVPGQYWVQVRSAGQKIAQVTFQAVPEPDPRSIRGMVTDPDGRPSVKKVALTFVQGEERFGTETGADGTFDVEVSPGSFTVEVRLLLGNQWNFVGWYDGAGITTDPARVFEITVDDADIVGIEIMFATDTLSHSVRGVVTYTGGQPPEGIALRFMEGEQRFRIETQPDGTFDGEVLSGSFIVEVNVLIDNHRHFAGWYNGVGITSDRAQALGVIVDDEDVEGIEIMISADTYPHSIQGVVTDTEGQPVEGLRLYAQQGQERLYEGETRSDGTFDIVVSSGSYHLVVLELDDSVWSQVGWYDGTSITEYRTQALEVIVEDTDVEGIEVILPTETSHASISGVVTDAEGRPMEGIWLAVLQGDEWLFDDRTGADGAFDIVASSGAFNLRVLVPVDDSTWQAVGWYDGAGGITTITGQAFELIMDDADVEEIEIMIPTYLLPVP